MPEKSTMSTSSSSPSIPNGTSNPETASYPNLLADRERLARLLLMFRGHLWADLRGLLLAERSQHLEALLNTNDPETALQHRTVARWIGEFFGYADSLGIDDRLREHDETTRAVEQANGSEPEPSDYMLKDSGLFDVKPEDDITTN
jgi:hypothetical protein